MKQFPFLDKALERLKPFLSDDRVSEISVNRPGEVFIERLGVAGMERVVDAQFTADWIRTLSERVAGSTNQVVN
jgi:type IV secretion system protein VirB11